ncbi:carnosine N-methyltransferase-like [Senna tora]|uniref:Carnosine N-methyltransferase-like n=1 Tax=Senna tora TaxID=362788 RepID=A0A834T2E8_9FABA|nr:carnosine N-methyltransferase-like [Senna tora]
MNSTSKIKKQLNSTSKPLNSTKIALMSSKKSMDLPPKASGSKNKTTTTTKATATTKETKTKPIDKNQKSKKQIKASWIVSDDDDDLERISTPPKLTLPKPINKSRRDSNPMSATNTYRNPTYIPQVQPRTKKADILNCKVRLHKFFQSSPAEMSGAEDMEDEERRRQLKLEEALEIKSLRRIVSAYLNYPDAAEEDVRRYERSFMKLPSAHKALLSHYPLKIQRLRRCISINSYFIFNMLQAFEPPLDMSQDIDMSEDLHPEHASKDHLATKEINAFLCESTSGRVMYSSSNDQGHIEGCKDTCRSSEPVHTNEEVDIEDHHQSSNGSPSSRSIHTIETGKYCRHLMADSNGNVSSSRQEWLDPSFQLHVPLVDVDKVRCIIRNIVRDWAAEGQKERDQCYKPILEELDALFPNRNKESPPTCLVPGAGLGRLALEISCLGFISQGNEFSYYMMICSSFILNNDQLRPVSIPDIHPASAGITEGFSMCGGDFVEVYSDPSQRSQQGALSKNLKSRELQ